MTNAAPNTSSVGDTPQDPSSASPALLREERAAEYARLAETGGLAQLSVPPPSVAESGRGRLIGTAGLSMGLGLVALILYAVFR